MRWPFASVSFPLDFHDPRRRSANFHISTDMATSAAVAVKKHGQARCSSRTYAVLQTWDT
jgi:hypothetical protein